MNFLKTCVKKLYKKHVGSSQTRIMVRNYEHKTNLNEFVYNDFMRYINRISGEHAIFKGNTKWTLPRIADDKRKATWEHVLRNLSRHILPVVSNQDCYLASFKDDKGNGRYAMHKFGNVNVGVHRTAAVLAYPDRVSDIDGAREEDENEPNKNLVVAHRCGNAKCCNPRHMAIVTQRENESHKGCRNGCAQLCPHTPRCIFVSKTGHYIPCLNRRRLPRLCLHKRACHPSLKRRRLSNKRVASIRKRLRQ